MKKKNTKKYKNNNKLINLHKKISNITNVYQISIYNNKQQQLNNSKQQNTIKESKMLNFSMRKRKKRPKN